MALDRFSFLNSIDIDYIDELHQRYLVDKRLVEPSWRSFFDGYEFSKFNYQEVDEIPTNVLKEFRVINLINAYRSRGHLFTKTNPVRERRKYHPTLEIKNFGLDQEDLLTVFQASEQVGLEPCSLNDIIIHLEATYCESIGIEYQYIRHPERVEWIRKNIELKNRPQFSKDQKKHILHKLNQATVFEQFLQKKFVGQKRFSIEGAESLIPALDVLIENGSNLGLKEFVVGMAHRGRLNVLANIFNKTYDKIFSEFEGKEYDEEVLFDGDVKYHLGITSEVMTDSGNNVKITLSPNPSHLEAVDPVVEGITRSKIDHELGGDEKKILPILIHGDAAIAGQGVVYEVVQMAQLKGYRTGGSLHIVINNQVGFTTNYLDARSSTYCTDIAKSTLCPVFHVNGDDIEAVVQTLDIALRYRQEYSRDVFVDLLCYRKYGHNEGDEPKFTQPKLYKIIANHPNPREIYLKKLVDENVVNIEEGNQMEKEFDDMLQERLDDAKQIEKAKITNFLEEVWTDFRKSKRNDFENSPPTGVEKSKLLLLAKKMNSLPEGKKYFRKIVKLFDDRLKMIESDKLDWAMGELLAYATLLDEGKSIRISGQDVERGTFSHRHAIVKTEDDEEEIVPLNLLNDHQGKFEIYNSLLSEYAVLGFDYGYAFNTPNGLTIWEAQFGDFFNGAQIIIDQFLSAAEDKWGTPNGLVMLLPHGYEGMGSEHSSARIERFLQLCAEENFQVANCTNPANYFHLLRRQIARPFRKPLVVFTPKKLLRYNRAVSSIQEMSSGSFQEVIDDSLATPSKINQVVLCSGKFYYDLVEHYETLDKANIAFVRLEQLYPYPETQLKSIFNKYGKDCKYVWAQEEPLNMGPWSYILRKWEYSKIVCFSREESGSPASGSPKVFERRQQEIINKVMSYS
ncbi:MAG: 2-oxoglutarate dehydrogenase E1 component [Parvicellaceae bacterium]|tara:strand:+ start:601 stop:3321 length:2721 start_codon:yes stop_codon:yes gene_type:complete